MTTFTNRYGPSGTRYSHVMLEKKQAYFSLASLTRWTILLANGCASSPTEF